LLNIFTKNFRKKSKRLTINELAQQRPRKFSALQSGGIIDEE
jgi:hypothetical protein